MIQISYDIQREFRMSFYSPIFSCLLLLVVVVIVVVVIMIVVVLSFYQLLGSVSARLYACVCVSV